MATVVLAEDTVLGRRVALKRMTGVADARGLSGLRREALVGASVSHPNLVSVYDVVADEDGDLIIVMEYVRGDTLRGALSTQGRLAPDEALRVLAGVAAIHERGIVHRDGATVAVRTTSVRSDGTKHCSGTVDLVPDASSGRWLLHLIHINCV
jgi:eukaryotic-like serine/threonine-protein kinase